MTRDNNDLIPMGTPSAGFDVVMRGYDRNQVNDWIGRLEDDLRTIMAERDQADADQPADADQRYDDSLDDEALPDNTEQGFLDSEATSDQQAHEPAPELLDDETSAPDTEAGADAGTPAAAEDQDASEPPTAMRARRGFLDSADSQSASDAESPSERTVRISAIRRRPRNR